MASQAPRWTAPRTAAETRQPAQGFSPDPFPTQGYGERRDVPWLYAAGDCERGLLHRLVTDGFAANRNVHYAQNHAQPELVRFRHPASGAQVEASPNEPTMRVVNGGGWEADAGGGWSRAQVRMGTDVPPHLLDEPSATLRPREISPGLFDAGATVLGHVFCKADREPALRTGESQREAMSIEPLESRHDLVVVDGQWRSAHRLRFRYPRLEGAEQVRTEATVRPVAAPGAFTCSDRTLNGIWETAAYTTLLCQQGLALDGVKRDRMPWAGDQALGLLTNAFTIADAEATADTLTALGSPVQGYVNGLADYSMWWVISQQEMCFVFGDRTNPDPTGSVSSVNGSSHLNRIAEAVDAFLSTLTCDVSADGVLRPRDLGSFAGGGPVLIDWGVNARIGEELTALQVLFVWALASATSLLTDAGHPGAARWSELHDQALTTLHRRGWHRGVGAWRTHLDKADTSSPYPQLLAVLAGLHGSKVPTAVSDRIDLSRVCTPFMTGFALRALHRSDRRSEALEQLRSLWAPMPESGATTSWEEFPHIGGSPYEKYSRPFDKSLLCHGWGAAPAVLLPEMVLGLRRLDHAWSTVEVRPQSGDLEWAAAVVPIPHGDLVAAAEGSQVHVEAPVGVRAVVRDDSPLAS